MSEPTAEPAAPPKPPEPPPARWPEWFRALDVAAAAFALAAVFLGASYAARNSAAFLHLAGGRALLKGQLAPGADPFSHAGAAGRPWADTNWLFDLAAYALYSADASGTALVAVKAVGVAVAVGLLLLLRTPGRPLFPWAVAAVLAAVALANAVPLDSATASLPFLAATLALVFRLDWTRPGWRNPLLLGGLFAVWANTDGWFVLGPAVVLAVYLGDLIDRLAGRPDATRPGLGRGLLVGAAACLLNPFVLAAVAKSPAEAAQLVPWELGFHLPAAVVDDPQLGASLTLKPLSDAVLKRLNDGDDPNLPALGLLVLLAAVGAVVCRSATVGLLTLLGLAVAQLNLRLSALGTVLLIPAVGWGLNHLAGYVPAGRAGEPATRILVTLSGLGRVLALLAAIAVGVIAAPPGWLHPPRVDPAYGKVYSQRVEWSLDPDPALARTAAMIKDWPADRKGLALGPDVANYAAWYAPGVRQFVTTRYAYHRADLPDLLTLRVAGLGRRSAEVPTTPSDLDDALDACDRLGGGYLVVTAGGASRRVDDQNPVNGQTPAVYAFALGSGDRWTLWHLDGRSAVLGRGPGGPGFDPTAAFRAGEPLPAGPTVPAPRPPADDPVEQWFGQVLNPVRPPPAEADDALTLSTYLSVTRAQADADYRRRSAPPRAALTGGLGAVLNMPAPRPPTDAELGLPLLVMRAARRAAVATPDRPEPYRAVLAAYSLPLAPAAEGLYSPVAGLLGNRPEAESQQVTAAARFLARLPVATANRELVIAGLEAALALSQGYEQTGQLDYAREALEKAQLLLKRLAVGGKDDPAAAERQRMEAREEALSGQIQRSQRSADRAGDPTARLQALIQAGLPGKAVALFKGGDPNGFSNPVGLALLVVQVELRGGKLEEAAADLDALDESARTTASPLPGLAEQMQELRGAVARLAGDPRTAATVSGLQASPIPPEFTSRLRKAPAEAVGLAAAAGMIAAVIHREATDRQASALVGAVVVEAAQQNARGLLALIDGDAAEAGRRFDAALTPLGQPLAEYDPPLADRLTRYRELIRRQAGK